MIGYVKFSKEDPKDRKIYHCAHCGAFITDSDAAVRIQGSEDHSFMNPVGILCNFTTFLSCENVLVHEDLFLQHSWFLGYGWRYTLCAICLHHLGWKYDAVKDGMRPRSFFGILIQSVEGTTSEQ